MSECHVECGRMVGWVWRNGRSSMVGWIVSMSGCQVEYGKVVGWELFGRRHSPLQQPVNIGAYPGLHLPLRIISPIRYLVALATQIHEFDLSSDPTRLISISPVCAGQQLQAHMGLLISFLSNIFIVALATQISGLIK